MYSAGPSGLQNAPITKLILIVVVGSSLFVSYQNAKTRMINTNNNQQTINNIMTLGNLSIRELFTNQLYFASIGEMIIGSLLLYSFRLFERIMGSSKYSLFVLSSIILSTLLQIAYIVIFKKGAFIGPYSIIFSSLILFFKEVPSTYWFKLFGFPLNDKIFSYIMAAQLMYSFPQNFGGCLTGMLSGVLYYTDLLSLRRRRMPRWMSSFCSTWIAPLLNSSPRPSSLRTVMELQQRHRQQQQHRQDTFGGLTDQLIQPTTPRGPPPSEQDIATLESMGFPRNRIIEALQLTNNNLNEATNYLLGSM